MFENEVTGEQKEARFKPFEMCHAAAWIDIVDEAVERAYPDRGSWMVIEEKLTETKLYKRGCTCREIY